MDQDEFRQRIYGTIKDKVFFSNLSRAKAEVVEKMPEQIVPGKVLFDGICLYDGIEGLEDDIQQMHTITKDGFIVNVEDYYSGNGAFDNDGMGRFLAALNHLMTEDEFMQFQKENK